MSDVKILVSQFHANASRLAENAGFESTRKYARLASRIGELFNELKLKGEPGFDELQKLLEDPNNWVRFAAAYCLLDHRTDAAIAVLDGMARQHGGVVHSQAAIRLFTWYFDRTGKYYEPGEKIEY